MRRMRRRHNSAERVIRAGRQSPDGEGFERRLKRKLGRASVTRASMYSRSLSRLSVGQILGYLRRRLEKNVTVHVRSQRGSPRSDLWTVLSRRIPLCFMPQL